MAVRYGFLLAAVGLAAVIGCGGPAAAAAPREGVMAATSEAAPNVHAREARGVARGRAANRVANRVAILRDPALATIAALRGIERIHRREGREKVLPDYLRGVLARTSDPTVRNYVTLRLARLGVRSGDTNAALRELERGVDENLGRLN